MESKILFERLNLIGLKEISNEENKKMKKLN